jgi:hypothetical protein
MIFGQEAFAIIPFADIGSDSEAVFYVWVEECINPGDYKTDPVIAASWDAEVSPEPVWNDQGSTADSWDDKTINPADWDKDPASDSNIKRC